MNVVVNGPPIMAAGVAQGLYESAEGSCGSNDPLTACTPASLQVSVTLEGEQSNDDSTSVLQPIRWTSSTGESGTCPVVYTQTGGASVDVGPAENPTEDTQCSLSAEGCTGGSIDALGMTMDLSGTFGYAIAAGVSMNGCCWRGTAVKQ
jgi:hypothetical protein